MIADEIDRVLTGDADLLEQYHQSPEFRAVMWTARHAGDDRAVEILVRAVAAATRTSESASRIAHAVHDAGPAPDHHHKVQRRHRREWPTLWRAIDELIGRRV